MLSVMRAASELVAQAQPADSPQAKPPRAKKVTKTQQSPRQLQWTVVMQESPSLLPTIAERVVEP